MKQKIYRLGTCLLFLCFIISPVNAAEVATLSPDSIPGSTIVAAEQLIDLAGTLDNLVIIDSRISDDRKQGYIESSISLPDENTDCDSLSVHIKNKHTPVVFYCNGPKCGRSAKAVNIALACAYRHVYWFRGGIEKWMAGNFPLTKE